MTPMNLSALTTGSAASAGCVVARALAHAPDAAAPNSVTIKSQRVTMLPLSPVQARRAYARRASPNAPDPPAVACNRWLGRVRRSRSADAPLEGIEIVVLAFVLVFTVHRQANCREQPPVHRRSKRA